MAKNIFLGTAVAVSQVDTYTPANPNTGDIYYLTLNGFDGRQIQVSFTVAGTETVAAVTAGLHAAWTASDAATYATSADGTTVLTLTAITSGVGFTVTPSIYDGSGGSAPTLSKAATTANGGPGDWSDATNWSLGTVPGAASGEDTYVQNSNVDILYGLDQSGISNTLDTLHISQTYTGKIGHNGATGLAGEYLKIHATRLFIGEYFLPGTASGSGRIKVDTDTVASTITVYNTGTAADSNKAACRLLMNNASTSIQEIRKGSVSIAQLESETATLGSAYVSYETRPAADASLVIGEGVTITTLECVGGENTMFTGATTVTLSAGSLLVTGDSTATITTLNVKGGTVKPLAEGTITTVAITGGICDFTASAEPRTVTTLTLDEPGTLLFDSNVMTFTNEVTAANTGRTKYRALKG